MKPRHGYGFGWDRSSTLIQTYRNPHAEPLEVVYTLPLPADGAVDPEGRSGTVRAVMERLDR